MIKPELMDKDLREKLIADKGGWLWLFKTACDKYRTEGLQDNESIKKAVKEYREEKFRIINYASNRLEFTGNDKDFITTNALFMDFKQFLIDEYDDSSDSFAGSQSNFKQQIKQ